MVDTGERALAAAICMHAERSIAPVVDDRDNQVTILRQRPADLDLPVRSIQATAQLEDPARPCRAAYGEQRTLAQLAVGLLGERLVRPHSGDEEARHLRRALTARAG